MDLLAFTFHRSVVKKMALRVTCEQLPLRVGWQTAQQYNKNTGEADTNT